MRVGSFITSSWANAPGDHCVVWFQGCRARCEGCINTELQPFEGGEQVGVQELFEHILQTGKDGVVFTGGEPLDQKTSEILDLLSLLSEARIKVVLYSGWTRKEISQDRWLSRVFGLVDLAILGPYDSSCPSSRPLQASQNQEIVLLSSRYRWEDVQNMPAGELIFDLTAATSVGTGVHVREATT